MDPGNWIELGWWCWDVPMLLCVVGVNVGVGGMERI